jgi:hypothetical protein
MKSVSVTRSGLLATGLLAGALSAVVGCNSGNNTDTTPTRGSLAQVELGAPGGSVTSNVPFNIDVHARSLGFSVLHNSKVRMVLPHPFLVDSAEVTSGGGSVTFSNLAAGSVVEYDFGAIDKLAQSSGTLHVRGVLGPTENNVRGTVSAELTADEVRAGDAEASVDITVQQ